MKSNEFEQLYFVQLFQRNRTEPKKLLYFVHFFLMYMEKYGISLRKDVQSATFCWKKWCCNGNNCTWGAIVVLRSPSTVGPLIRFFGSKRSSPRPGKKTRSSAHYAMFRTPFHGAPPRPFAAQFIPIPIREENHIAYGTPCGYFVYIVLLQAILNCVPAVGKGGAIRGHFIGIRQRGADI